MQTSSWTIQGLILLFVMAVTYTQGAHMEPSGLTRMEVSEPLSDSDAANMVFVRDSVAASCGGTLNAEITEVHDRHFKINVSGLNKAIGLIKVTPGESRASAFTEVLNAGSPDVVAVVFPEEHCSYSVQVCETRTSGQICSHPVPIQSALVHGGVSPKKESCTYYKMDRFVYPSNIVVEAIMKPNEVVDLFAEYLYPSAAYHNIFQYRCNELTGALRLYYQQEGKTIDMTMADRCGKWSHVVWTLSETGTFQGYINGNFIGTGCTNCIYTPGDSEDFLINAFYSTNTGTVSLTHAMAKNNVLSKVRVYTGIPSLTVLQQLTGSDVVLADEAFAAMKSTIWKEINFSDDDAEPSLAEGSVYKRTERCKQAPTIESFV